MVKVVCPDGGVYHEPPYTKGEEMDLYRRMGPPVTIQHAPKIDCRPCKICGRPNDVGDLCPACAAGNDPFKTSDNSGADLKR